jgi:hypothetical protein
MHTPLSDYRKCQLIFQMSPEHLLSLLHNRLHMIVHVSNWLTFGWLTRKYCQFSEWGLQIHIELECLPPANTSPNLHDPMYRGQRSSDTPCHTREQFFFRVQIVCCKPFFWWQIWSKLALHLYQKSKSNGKMSVAVWHWVQKRWKWKKNPTPSFV